MGHGNQTFFLQDGYAIQLTFTVAINRDPRGQRHRENMISLASLMWTRANHTNRLVEEVALLGQVHGDSRLAGSLNNFLIADGTTGLNNRAYTSVGKHLETVGKREEGIRCSNSTASTVFTGTLNLQPSRVDTVDLPHANAHCRTIFSQQNGVGLHSAHGAPREGKVVKRLVIGWVTGNKLPR